MTVDNVTPLPGIPELTKLLRDEGARIMLVAYLNKEGNWGYSRYSQFTLVGESEVGAAHILLAWLCKKRLEEDADE